MPDDPAVVLLVPLAPAPTGNGLAMRAGMLLDALAGAAAVHVVVVPVSGSAATSRWAEERARDVIVVAPITPEASTEQVTRQLADTDLRERLQRTMPLPPRAQLAPPTLAPLVAARLGTLRRPAAVLAMRLYLAPLGARLAHRLGAERLVIDVDDDDGALLRSVGDTACAEACDRLARVWLPDADMVVAASPTDAAGVAARAGVPCEVVPNAAPRPSRTVSRPGADRLLFVGNLTYEPNRVAARLLVRDVLPAVRRQRPTVTADIVGAHDGAADDLGGPGVRVTGAVPDVTPYYEGADLVVVPLRHGAGTRIKVLEALAHGRPVVATPTAVAGLELDALPPDGGPVATTESPEDMAALVLRRLAEPGGARVEEAARRLTDRFSPAVLAPLVRAAVLGRAAGSSVARATPAAHR